MWMKVRARVFVLKWKAPLYLSRRVYHANEVLISRYGKLNGYHSANARYSTMTVSLSLVFFSPLTFSRILRRFQDSSFIARAFFSIASNFSQGDDLERRVLTEYKQKNYGICVCVWIMNDTIYILYMISLLSFLEKKSIDETRIH